MSYGSSTNVAALASTWTANGVFTDATTPTLAQVEAWIAQMSSTVDLALSGEGFVTPLTDVTAVAAAAAIVEGVVADLCHAAHKSGRFFTKNALESGISPIRAVSQELSDWAASNKVSFRTLGVATVTDAVGTHTASFDIL